MKELSSEIMMDIVGELAIAMTKKNEPLVTDINDIGNLVGIAVGRHIAKLKDHGYDSTDFISGFKHGISLMDGTH